MITKIVYFNTWHNGDVFAMKGYMHAVQKQLPHISFAFAHGYSPKLIQDLGFEHMSITQVPAEATADRFTVIADTLYVNTWVGKYMDLFEVGQKHSNYKTLHGIWNVMKQEFSAQFSLELSDFTDPLDYIPTTQWTQFEINAADDFISQYPNYIVVCNGLVRSEQSDLGLMQNIITSLAEQYPDKQIVCTAKFTTETPNIRFTDDIFSSTTNGDLNEIAYLSTCAEMIIGKNSGPYMFAHTRDTMFNPDIKFLSLSQRPTDSYPYSCDGFNCQYFHHSQAHSERIFNIIVAIMEDQIQALPGKMTLVEYQD